jgi:type VI protein secretion system component VasA
MTHQMRRITGVAVAVAQEQQAVTDRLRVAAMGVLERHHPLLAHPSPTQAVVVVDLRAAHSRVVEQVVVEQDRTQAQSQHLEPQTRAGAGAVVETHSV